MVIEQKGSVVADVKCYHCGHISGQFVGPRHTQLRVGNFVPRPGYKGPEVKPGKRLRCERCQGPVFLEDSAAVGPEALRAARQGSLSESKAA